MDDTVYRQAAIDVAIEAAYKWDGCYSVERAHIIADDMKALPSAKPEQRWIPVSERLPEEKDAGILKKLGTSKRSDYVLATVEVRNERMTVTACTYDGVWYWNMKYAFPDYEVVAWMPLPEPYTERREE